MKDKEIDQPCYTAGDLVDKLNYSEATIRRRSNKGLIPGKISVPGRHFFNKEVIDEWLRTDQPAFRLPTSPIQQQAYEMCSRGDHSWMADEQYAGNSYTNEEASKRDGNLVKVWFRRKCYFCRHVENVQI